jgi:hypothetical protein
VTIHPLKRLSRPFVLLAIARRRLAAAEQAAAAFRQHGAVALDAPRPRAAPLDANQMTGKASTEAHAFKKVGSRGQKA